MNDLEALRRLQEHDVVLARLEKEIATSRKAVADASSPVAKLEQLVERTREEVKKAKKAVHLKEVDVAAIQEKRKALEPRLNQATTMKAAEAVKHEMANLDGKIEALEEELLGLMEKEEEAAGMVAQAEAALKKTLEKIESGNAALPETLKKIQAEIEKEQVERDKWREYLPAELIETYDGLRKKLKGRVVVEAEESCPGCDGHFTEGTQAELRNRRDEIQRCPHCKRLLIFVGVDRL